MFLTKFKYFLNAKQSTITLSFLILLFLMYVPLYLSHPALPHDAVSGWWGWWDQSQYIKSAKAFSQLDLSPSEHWYFPGYALLAAVFYKFAPVHAFFVVNAICLTITAFCFIRIAHRFGVNAVAASAVFAFSTAFNSVIIEQFVIPWTTTPTCAIIYIIITLFLDRTENALKFFLIGLLGSAVLMIRPTDVISTAPIFIFLAANAAIDLTRNKGNHHKRVFPPTLVFLIAGGLTGLLCALLIYYSIYGWSVSPYLATSQNIGFIFSALPIKLYVLFVEPTTIYGQGTAILRTYPWIFISLIGIICCLAETSRLSIVAACVLLHVFFYACYADLLPTNIWHFKLIHYLKWTFPLLGLFAWITVKNVLSGRSVRATAALAVGLFCLLSVRVGLEAVESTAGAAESPTSFQAAFADMEQIAAIDLPMKGGSVKGLDNWPLSITAEGKNLHRYADFLAAPQTFGLRIILARTVHAEGISGVFETSGAMSPTGQSPIGRRYSIGLGWPCWLPPYGCAASDAGSDFALPDDGQITFQKGGSSSLYAAKGWSGQEEWGTWTDGAEAALKIPFKAANIPVGHDLELAIEANAFGNHRHPRQNARLIINDEPVAEFSVDVADGVKAITVKIPRHIAVKRHPVSVVLRLDDATSPKALEVSDDPRNLGIGLRRMVLKAVPSSQNAQNTHYEPKN
jgi:hypothetical protein